MPAGLLTQKMDENRWKWATTGLYSASFASLGLTFSILGPTLPALAEHTHATLTEISWLFIARSVGSLVGSVGGGRLFDRYPGHTVIAVSLACIALATASVPVIPMLWVLILALFLSGIVHGMLNVGCNAMLVWVHREKVAAYMNALHFFFGLGTFLAPILVAEIVLRSGGIAWAYWLIALAFVPVLIYAWLIPSPQPAHASNLAGQGRADPWLVAGFTLIFLGYSGSSAAHGGWIFTYLTHLGLADETTAAYVTSVFWGALTAGRLLSIPLAVRFSPKAMLRFDLLGALASLALMAVFPQSILVLALGSGGLGFFLATIFPTNMSLASRHIPITGGVTGILSIGSSLGALILPWLVGQWFESAGPFVLLGFNLVNITLTLGVYFWLIGRIEP